MKKTLLFVCSMMLCASIQAADFETAKEAVKNMGVGWNLGNTLEAHNQKIVDITNEAYWGQQGLESETCWGQPKATRELIHMMKEAGFDAIRVPVTWYNHMNSGRVVEKEWMDRVKEVVNYVLDEDMYCIINVHHDTGADSYDANGKLTGSHWIHADYYSDLEKTLMDILHYTALWTQIAREFYNYGPKLLFESQNETLDKLNSWCYASFSAPGQYDEEIAKSAYKAINEYNKAFITAVRSVGNMSPTGGDIENAKNDKRNLIINTYGACNGAGTWNEHLKEPLTNLEIPEGEKDHIIVEVHAYPSIANGNTDKSISTIKSETTELMDGLKSNFVSKGIPVIIGEWSTSNVDKSQTDYDVRKSLMLQFVDDFVKQAKDNGIATFYWMGLSDGAARSLPAFNQADLAKAIVKAYHGSTSDYKYPSTDSFTITYTVKYTDEWSEAFLFGDWGRTAQKLSDYKGIRLEMDNDYSGKLQLKIYGDKTGEKNADGSDKFKEQITGLTAGSNTTEVTFDTSILGSTFWGVTLQTLAGALTAKVKKATLIKADGSEVTLTVTKAWGCEVSSESSPSSGIRSIRATPNKGESQIYNLNGQRISTPHKGIYILNGKKYVMK